METGLRWTTAAPLILGLCWRSQAGQGGVKVMALGICSHKGTWEQLTHSSLAFPRWHSVGLFTSSDMALHLLPRRPLQTGILASKWSWKFTGYILAIILGNRSSWEKVSSGRHFPSARSPLALLSDLKQRAQYPAVFVLIMVNSIRAPPNSRDFYALFLNDHHKEAGLDIHTSMNVKAPWRKVKWLAAESTRKRATMLVFGFQCLCPYLAMGVLEVRSKKRQLWERVQTWKEQKII